VAELSKAKLERPKRLGELAQRAWGEVLTGAHLWGRQAAEVEQLAAISRSELLQFAQQVGLRWAGLGWAEGQAAAAGNCRPALAALQLLLPVCRSCSSPSGGFSTERRA
jgi:hypothetical protein